jgi:hypothetical protein
MGRPLELDLRLTQVPFLDMLLPTEMGKTGVSHGEQMPEVQHQ